MPIKIKSKQNNFRRCGIPHPDQWTEYPDDRFSKADLKTLKAEPMLIVEEVEAKKEKGYADMTKSQLILLLKEKGVDIPANATKDELLDLIGL